MHSFLFFDGASTYATPKKHSVLLIFFFIYLVLILHSILTSDNVIKISAWYAWQLWDRKKKSQTCKKKKLVKFSEEYFWYSSTRQSHALKRRKIKFAIQHARQTWQECITYSLAEKLSIFYLAIYIQSQKIFHSHATKTFARHNRTNI